MFKDRVTHKKAQDYPDIITHSLCKCSSIIPAELSHSLFAVGWFTQSQHVTGGVPALRFGKHAFTLGDFLTDTEGQVAVILQKSSYNFCRDYQLRAEGNHGCMTSLNLYLWRRLLGHFPELRATMFMNTGMMRDLFKLVFIINNIWKKYIILHILVNSSWMTSWGRELMR